MRKKAKILIVDDEKTLCHTLSEVLTEEGYEAAIEFNGMKALEKIKQEAFDVIFCDLRMPNIDGMQLLEKTMILRPETFFIVMTAYASMETTLKALKLGAHDYVMKPLVFEDILLKLKHLIAYRELSVEKRIVKDMITEQFALDNVLGQGTEMKAIYSLVQKVAPTPATILITGEIGVGKGKLAKAIHLQSEQRKERFMIVRCGSYREAELDEALFGHRGIFYRSEKGTLFLDEISDLYPSLQFKLVTLLSSRISKKGSVRLIISTTKDLFKEMTRGKFREDLLYRMNTIEIKIPPLRARRNDIPFLVKYYVKTHSERLGKKVRYVADPAIDVLMNYPWKGNIRELQNVLERSILLCDSNTQYLGLYDLPSEMVSTAHFPTSHHLKEAMKQYGYKHIQWVLEKNHFNKGKTAVELGLSLSSLYRKMGKLSFPLTPLS